MPRILVLYLALCVTFSLTACNSDAPNSITGATVDETTAPVSASTTASPQVIPPGATPQGKTYAEWSVEWWRWLWSSTPAENPGLDETGENVGYGQSGKVWFIAPNYGGVSERSATIPTGRMLFVDVVAWFFAPLIGDPEDEAELRAAAAAATDATTNVRLEVDGVVVPNIEDYRVQSDLFSYTIPEDNMFSFFGLPAEAGTYYPAVSDGYFVMLPPLSAGQHTLRMYAELPGGSGVSDVTLHLMVKGGAKGARVHD